MVNLNQGRGNKKPDAATPPPRLSPQTVTDLVTLMEVIVLMHSVGDQLAALGDQLAALGATRIRELTGPK